jgi:hypothetical protein
MNNVQPSTPGFVLTSLSFGQNKKNTLKIRNHSTSATESPSSIAKFDYCLPPDEFNYFDLPDGEQAA